MEKLFFIALAGLTMVSCNSKVDSTYGPDSTNASTAKDTLRYAYMATYSSDITVPSHPEFAQKALIVWKMFENNQIDSMKPYWADTITYHDANGLNFHGPSDKLLSLAKKDIEGLDSLRFDLSVWQSEHVNDKNEDWVRIWAMERRYPKKGKADSSLIQENWLIKDGRFTYFNQYKANLPK